MGGDIVMAVLINWIITPLLSPPTGPTHNSRFVGCRWYNLGCVEPPKLDKGCFQMGSNNGDNDEKPIHRVCLNAYEIGKYEITQFTLFIIIISFS